MNTIKHVVFYAHPAEDVWKYITQPELIKQWLMESDFKPVLAMNSSSAPPHYQLSASTAISTAR
jgi:uncharacterized protein YndB with AHSA1/START domain